MTIVETICQIEDIANEIYHANIVTLEQREELQRLAKLASLQVARFEGKLKEMMEGT